MSDTHDDDPETGSTTDAAQATGQFLRAAYDGDLEAIKTALSRGVKVNAADPETGLTALHLAVGRDHLNVARYLIEDARAGFLPDRRGRFPTTIAAQCEVSEELGDYIVEKEAEDQRG